MRTVRKTKHRFIEIQGSRVFYREAGTPEAPTLLLLHGFPSSSHSFRDVMTPLAEVAHVIAPDLPGFGFTEVPRDYDHTFENMTQTINAFTRQLGLSRFFLYVHDFGAPIAYRLALAEPDRVLGLVIQNGNAHEEGLGAAWDTVRAYWADPTPERRAQMPEYLNFEGTRAQYLSVPDRLQPLIAPEGWHSDWERMNSPRGVQIQFRIAMDYANHVAEFSRISEFHERYQPPALLLWGRHDVFFEIEEVLAYHRELERLDMHLFDAGHLLLETHSAECAALMNDFILEVGASRQ